MFSNPTGKESPLFIQEFCQVELSAGTHSYCHQNVTVEGAKQILAEAPKILTHFSQKTYGRHSVINIWEVHCEVPDVHKQSTKKKKHNPNSNSQQTIVSHTHTHTRTLFHLGKEIQLERQYFTKAKSLNCIRKQVIAKEDMFHLLHTSIVSL